MTVFSDAGVIGSASGNPYSKLSPKLKARVDVRVKAVSALLRHPGSQGELAIRSVAARFGISPMTLRRHREKVISLPPKDWPDALSPSYTKREMVPIDVDVWHFFLAKVTGPKRVSVKQAWAATAAWGRQANRDVPCSKTLHRRLRIYFPDDASLNTTPLYGHETHWHFAFSTWGLSWVDANHGDLISFAMLVVRDHERDQRAKERGDKIFARRYAQPV